MQSGNRVLGNDAYVVGMGCITSNSKNKKELTSALVSGSRKFNYLDNTTYIGAEINARSLIDIFSEYYKALPDLIVRRIKRHVYKAQKEMIATIASVTEAYLQANLIDSGIVAGRIGIVVAGSNLTYKIKEDFLKKCINNPEYLSPKYALNLFDSNYVSVISEIFNLTGEGTAVGGASASGNVAIIKAFQLIQLGVLDVCFIIAPPSGMTSIELQAFYNIGALGGKKFASKPMEACRPFDIDHEGFILGEAAACIILESGKSVRKRKFHPFAALLGGGIILDGNHSSNPSLVGEGNVMELAMSNSGINIRDVSYINTHGSSSPLGDITEANVINRIFHEYLDKIWVNSSKSILGHCLTSAGVIEAIATILQMDNEFIHMNVNLEKPIDNEILFAKKRIENVKIQYAISNSFGFGGINTSIVLAHGI